MGCGGGCVILSTTDTARGSQFLVVMKYFSFYSNRTGVTEHQVYHDVYPVWTYSYLAVLIIVFLCTDLAKYKPVIILEGFAYILTWVLLIWGSGLSAMQMMQVSDSCNYCLSLYILFIY